VQSDDRQLLPAEDLRYLEEKAFDFEVHNVSGELLVVIHHFALPAAYNPRECDLLVRLPVGYPNANPDMYWTRPDVQLAGGGTPRAAEHREPYLGTSWQRWSRHFPGGWRPGIDGLRSYLAAVRHDLEKGT